MRIDPMPSRSIDAAPLLFKGSWREFDKVGHHMRNFLKFFIRDVSGSSAAEYALILAIIGAGVAVTVMNLGTAISTAFDTTQGNF